MATAKAIGKAVKAAKNVAKKLSKSPPKGKGFSVKTPKGYVRPGGGGKKALSRAASKKNAAKAIKGSGSK